MTAQSNTQVLFKEAPGKGWVELKHFEVKTATADLGQIQDGQLLLKNLFLSVDPYMRGRMNVSQKSYTSAFELGKPLQGGGIAQVLESKRPGFEKGDIVSCMINWEQYTVLDSKFQATKLQPVEGVPLSYYLGILGMPGATAYAGLLDIGEPKEGETVFVSGAAGAVGLVVGQLAKIKGCKVVGSAGSDDKVALLKSEFGFDEAFNYKTVESIDKKLSELAPKGVDVYFDNVGGETLDAAINNMNRHGRIIACGMISQYNATPETAYNIKNIIQVVGKEIKIQGFIVSSRMTKDFFARFLKDIPQWIKEGKLKYSENVVEGIENAPSAFINMLKGENTGKQVVKI
ncbi:NADP-dependent dehydrogenase [Gorgonomyces haynaldii]|nr:NADP-dependent dehydrogenase [Gorgonomyces haynaldii]